MRVLDSRSSGLHSRHGGYFWQKEQGELDAANVTYNEQLALGEQWAAQDTYVLMERMQELEPFHRRNRRGGLYRGHRTDLVVLVPLLQA